MKKYLLFLLCLLGCAVKTVEIPIVNIESISKNKNIDAPQHRNHVTYFLDDDNQTVEILEGTLIDLKLPPLYSVGAIWHTASVGIKGPVIFIGDSEEDLQTFKFLARTAGVANITMYLVRPWEPNIVLKEFHITIIIKELNEMP